MIAIYGLVSPTPALGLGDTILIRDDSRIPTESNKSSTQWSLPSTSHYQIPHQAQLEARQYPLQVITLLLLSSPPSSLPKMSTKTAFYDFTRTRGFKELERCHHTNLSNLFSHLAALYSLYGSRSVEISQLERMIEKCKDEYKEAMDEYEWKGWWW